jgi:hypothetical protein
MHFAGASGLGLRRHRPHFVVDRARAHLASPEGYARFDPLGSDARMRQPLLVNI